VLSSNQEMAHLTAYTHEGQSAVEREFSRVTFALDTRSDEIQGHLPDFGYRAAKQLVGVDAVIPGYQNVITSFHLFVNQRIQPHVLEDGAIKMLA